MKSEKLITTFHLISEIEPFEIRKLLLYTVHDKAKDCVYNFFRDLSGSYPFFDEWFINSVIPEVEKRDGRREIIFAITENSLDGLIIISGIAILKKTQSERKICTLGVHADYRNIGIGSELFEKSFKFLGTRKPVISFSEDRIIMFMNHIKKYHFERTQILNDYYQNGIAEYVYNGFLE